MAHPCEAPWTQEGFPDHSKLAMVRAEHSEFMVDENFGRPTHLRRHYLPFVFFRALLSSLCCFHKCEVFVKEKEEKQAVSLVHIIFFILK